MKPLDSFVLFIDRSLGKQIIATVLRNASFQVEVHDDHFKNDAKDQEWLTEVGRKGWVILTKDKKIKHRAPELAAIVAVKARVFTLAAGSVQGLEMAQIFMKAMPKIKSYKAMPKIKSYVEGNAPPFIVRVSKSGHLARVYPPN